LGFQNRLSPTVNFVAEASGSIRRSEKASKRSTMGGEKTLFFIISSIITALLAWLQLPSSQFNKLWNTLSQCSVFLAF